MDTHMPQHKPVLARVYSYVRFSSPQQEKGTSLSRQTDAAKAVAKAKGLVLDKSLTMKDRGLSAYHGKNVSSGALGIFLEAIQNNMVARGSVLVVEALDRLTRKNPRKALPILEQICEAGVTIITAEDNKEYTEEVLDDPMGLMWSIMLLSKGYKESQLKSTRIQAAQEAKIKAWLGDPEYKKHKKNIKGRHPFWLLPNQTGVGYHINESTLPIMKHILTEFESGKGAKTIANDMRGKYTNPESGKGWSYHFVFTALRSPALYGMGKFKRSDDSGIKEPAMIEDYYPALMTKKDFEMMQLRLDSINHDKVVRSRKGVSLITGLGICVCGYCSSSVSQTNNWQAMERLEKKAGRRYPSHRRYTCNNNHRDCDASSLSQNVIDDAIVTTCSTDIAMQDLMRNNASSYDTIALEIKEEEVKAIKKQHVELLDQAMSSNLPASIVKRIEAMEDDITSREAEIKKEKLALLAAKDSQLSGIADKWKQIECINTIDYTKEEREYVRNLIRQTFDKIIIFSNGFHRCYDRIMDDGEPSIDVIVKLKNGTYRLISIHAETAKVRSLAFTESQVDKLVA